MTIGELANVTGVSTKTIRYYEEIGVMPSPARADNGYRQYEAEALDRLRFIRDAQASGLTLTEISSIGGLRELGEPTCSHVVALLRHHLADLDTQIETLKRARRRHIRLLERAETLDPRHCTDPIRCQTIAGSLHH